MATRLRRQTPLLLPSLRKIPRKSSHLRHRAVRFRSLPRNPLQHHRHEGNPLSPSCRKMERTVRCVFLSAASKTTPLSRWPSHRASASRHNRRQKPLPLRTLPPCRHPAKPHQHLLSLSSSQAPRNRPPLTPSAVGHRQKPRRGPSHPTLPRNKLPRRSNPSRSSLLRRVPPTRTPIRSGSWSFAPSSEWTGK